jgi:uncharacterized membrane-anchored protein YjiN (DUF445 family)
MPDSLYEKIKKVKNKEQANEIIAQEIIRCKSGSCSALSDEKIEKIIRSNIGYISVKFPPKQRKLIEDLFDCEHPFLGKSKDYNKLTPAEIFKIGQELGSAMNVLDQLRDKIRKQITKCNTI